MEPTPTYELPMFPLGLVLLPTAVLPLHIFEPRYRALAAHLVEASSDDPHAAEFGVVLIERGSDVGGGETRTDIGTVARAVQAEQFPDGRWALVAVGMRRIRVLRWLDDDPWPRALVADWPDSEPSGTDEAGLARYPAIVATLRRTLALASELGDEPAAATTELTDDPSLGSFQIGALGPFGPSDRQRLLSADGAAERLDLAATLVAEHLDMLEQRLSMEASLDDDDTL